ncbi:hypothetical protein U1Q18_014862 [Sarracenia purpurea var. burkii]
MIPAQRTKSEEKLINYLKLFFRSGELKRSISLTILPIKKIEEARSFPSYPFKQLQEGLDLVMLDGHVKTRFPSACHLFNLLGAVFENHLYCTDTAFHGGNVKKRHP